MCLRLLTTCLFYYALLDVVLAAEVLHALGIDLKEERGGGFLAAGAT